MRRGLCVVCAAVATVSVIPAANGQSVTYQKIALSGENAPGTSETFKSFSSPVITNAGWIVYAGGLIEDSGLQLNSGIYRQQLGGGTPQLVAREASFYQPNALGFYQFDSPPLISDAGVVTIHGRREQLSNDNAIWSGTPGSMTLFAAYGESVSGGTLSYAGQPVMNGSGTIAAVAPILNGAGSLSVLWRGTPGNRQALVSAGDAIPGGGGDTFSYIEPFPLINASGQVAFYGSGTNTGGMFRADAPGNVQAIARWDEPAADLPPEAPQGLLFGSFSGQTINSAGVVAFHNLTYHPSDNNLYPGGIWVGTAGNLKLAALDGLHAPGTPAGVVYHDIQNEPTLSDDGRVDFFSQLSGPGVDASNDSALFLGKPGDMHLLVREGDIAPGTNGATFRGWDWPHLNSRGDSLFLAFLSGSGITADNDRAVYATDPSGVMQLLARTGDLFEVAPGDVRTIEGCDYQRFYTTHGGGDGRPRSLNDLGQVALWLQFTDGSSGIFVATLPVPEPSALAILTAAAGLAVRRRRTPRRIL